MKFTYDKSKENIKSIVQQEIESHKKYETFNEIDGTIKDDKVTLTIVRDIPVTTGKFFTNSFYGKINDNNNGSEIIGRFSMKPLSLVLLIILFLLCIETIVFNLICQNPISNIIPAIVILAAELGIFVVQYINGRKDKRIILDFLNRI